MISSSFLEFIFTKSNERTEFREQKVLQISIKFQDSSVITITDEVFVVVVVVVVF